MGNANSTRRIDRLPLLAAWLMIVAGCSTTGTTTDRVWQDSARADIQMGNTLVVWLTPSAELTVPLENEWARQLQARDMEAVAANTLLPGQYPPDESGIVALVKEHGFSTLLVCRLLRLKKVGRDASHYQAGVVETKLYDTMTGKPFWTARSDTFMLSGAGDQIRVPREDAIRAFVATVIEEMSSSGVL